MNMKYENAKRLPTQAAALTWEELKKDSQGLVPVIIQDAENGEVLMMAYMNEQAYKDTLQTGLMHYYSRSRREQWLKGETSGHYQYVKSLTADCDRDTLLAKIDQVGAACHTGSRSCFFQKIVEQ
ncbi:MAG: phosphoribosyl-AMP cyclohydrolase [Lachnospiraceae bacterium]|nr:phosphoribosyl-AMP cyclohydrolase [Lachnospiraceae bacterium]